MHGKRKLRKVFFWGVGAIIGWQILSFIGFDPVGIPVYQRQALAEMLGVEYDGSRRFPYGFFEEQIDEGMTIDRVHEIVREFHQVYDCGAWEVYYFYSDSHKDALRFEIIYDYSEELDSYVVGYFGGEDEDSRTINVDKCHLGRSGE